MRIYSVHIRRGGLDPERDIVLVKEGFSWPAALFVPVWAAWHGLWAAAAIMLVSMSGLMAVATGLGVGSGSEGLLLAGTATVIGFLANDLFRASLEWRGFVMLDIVAAPNREAAEFRFFDRNPALAADIAASARIASP